MELRPLDISKRQPRRDELHRALGERMRNPHARRLSCESEHAIRQRPPSHRALKLVVERDGLGHWHNYLVERVTLCDVLGTTLAAVAGTCNADLVQRVLDGVDHGC